MKKFLITLIFLQNIIFPLEEVNIINNFKQGKYIDKLEDGSIEKGTYINHLKNGEYILEYPDLNLTLKGTYFNNLLHGIEKIYKNNDLVGEISYFQNEVLGNQLEYIEELTRTGYMGMYKNGYFEMKTDDSIITYKEEDELINGQVIINKNNGDKIYLSFFEGINLGDIKYVNKNGDIKYYEYLFDIENITPIEEKFLENIYMYLEEGNVKKENNLKQGPVKIQINDATIEYNYINNEITGNVKLTFPNVTKQISFIKGKREGTSIYNMYNLIETRNYKNDLLDGETTLFNQHITYFKGKVIKIIKQINENSKLITNFINEKPVGNLILIEDEQEKIIGFFDENHILISDGKKYAKQEDKLEMHGTSDNIIYVIAIKKNGEKRQYKSLNDYQKDNEYVIIEKGAVPK
ncbi:hypothetical protein [Streptobacillus canis]|uniref:hypothetical protein n=1 Tax=Streptobacillus canis TaxID=2678686 RepID=UPI0012E1F8CD|nr:hypothetical protein [Streptobacillus canis]